MQSGVTFTTRASGNRISVFSAFILPDSYLYLGKSAWELCFAGSIRGFGRNSVHYWQRFPIWLIHSVSDPGSNNTSWRYHACWMGLRNMLGTEKRMPTLQVTVLWGPQSFDRLALAGIESLLIFTAVLAFFASECRCLGRLKLDISQWALAITTSSTSCVLTRFFLLACNMVLFQMKCRTFTFYYGPSTRLHG